MSRPSLRFVLSAAAAIVVAAATCAGRPGGAGSGEATGEVPGGPILAVVGGMLIDGTGAPPIPDSAIIIEGGRIQAAGPRRQIRIPPGSIPVDATDLTVIPGLVDMHVHIVDGLDLETFLEYGVTSVRHLGDTTLEWITDVKGRVERGELPGPRIFHCGRFVVSQPPLDPGRYTAELLERFAIMRSPSDAERVVRELVDSGADVVKVKTEMSSVCLRSLCAAAAEARLPVSFDNAGESGSYDALTALEAGALGVEHLNGILFDDPVATEAALNKMLEVRAFAVPTFVVLNRTYSEQRVAARSTFIRRFIRMGGTVLAGTDVPTRGRFPGVSLHEELVLLTRAGLTPEQALMAATAWAGRALGYQGLVGTIEAGAYADLVIVYGNPNEKIADAAHIVRVLKGGRQVFPPGEDVPSN